MKSARAHYNAHGVRMTVEAESRSLLDVVDTVLGPYASSDGVPDGFRVSLNYGEMRQNVGPELRDFWSGTLVNGTYMICRTGRGRRQFEVPDRIQADVNLAERRAGIVVRSGDTRGLLEACVIPLLCNCLGQAGHHIIHAASLFVETGGHRRALVVSGVSGAGKTTLALALSRAGLGMLADDMTFYQAATVDQPGQVWGIRIGCKVCPQTFELLPWLRNLPSKDCRLNGERLLNTQSLGPQTAGLTASPGLILFLNPRNTKTHRIEPVDKLTALTRLTRENVRAPEPHRDDVGGRAFEAMAELVRSSCAFQASLCPDMEELPARIVSLWS